MRFTRITHGKHFMKTLLRCAPLFHRSVNAGRFSLKFGMVLAKVGMAIRYLISILRFLATFGLTKW